MMTFEVFFTSSVAGVNAGQHIKLIALYFVADSQLVAGMDVLIWLFKKMFGLVRHQTLSPSI